MLGVVDCSLNFTFCIVKTTLDGIMECQLKCCLFTQDRQMLQVN